ncbi:MAG TPA: hypothetical protein VK308_03630 [Pyrinomonadaceae bacterium]|nr:hypothetical protein [Pyrinomonadaceae bacterium]
MFRNSSEGGAGDRVPNSRRELFEQSKLSRLPERKTFKLPDFSFEEKPTTARAACVGCGSAIDGDSPTQKAFSGCRKCVGIYGRLDAAYVENSERKKRETLERFALEVKR